METFIERCRRIRSRFPATSTVRECRVLLAVAGQEVAQPLDGVGEVARPRQRHDPQVIRCGPIESGALSDQNLLRQQQIEDELLVVDDADHFSLLRGLTERGEPLFGAVVELSRKSRR